MSSAISIGSTTHAHGAITNAGAIGVASDLPVKTGTDGVLEAGAFGSTAGTFSEGNHAHFTTTTTKTAAYPAVAWEHVLVDSNAAAGDFAVTMPASPSVGQQVRVTMIHDHATRVVTLDGNGSDAIESDANNSPGKYTLCLEGDSVLLEWVGGGCGWAVVTDGIIPHVCMMGLTASMTTNTANTQTLVPLNDAVINPYSMANTSSYHIKIRRAGYYDMSAIARPHNGLSSGHYYIVYFHVNEVYAGRLCLVYAGTASVSPSVSMSSVETFASGDELAIYIQPQAANIGARPQTFLSVREIR